MRVPNRTHTARPWRIHELVPGFRLEDVWALPTPGDPHDFRRPTLRDRLPADLRNGPSVHEIMHLGRVEDPDGGWRGEMGVYLRAGDGGAGTPSTTTWTVERGAA